jgi:hypothetical protein
VAEVTVFVDDAVMGTLPLICTKEGAPTSDRLRVRSDVGDRAGLGVAWLLLLAGPLGWVGLLLISASRGGGAEVLTVELPVSEVAYQRLRAARHLRWRGCVAGVIGGAGVFVTALGDAPLLLPLAVVVVVVAIVILFVADRRIRATQVGVELDASRRWVTLSRVHPNFAAACTAQTRERQRT